MFFVSLNVLKVIENAQTSICKNVVSVLKLCINFLEEKASGVNKSWGDLVEDDEDEVRTPGHAVHMHEKLSSPSRKR